MTTFPLLFTPFHLLVPYSSTLLPNRYQEISIDLRFKALTVLHIFQAAEQM